MGSKKFLVKHLNSGVTHTEDNFVDAKEACERRFGTVTIKQSLLSETEKYYVFKDELNKCVATITEIE